MRSTGPITYFTIRGSWLGRVMKWYIQGTAGAVALRLYLVKRKVVIIWGGVCT